MTFSVITFIPNGCEAFSHRTHKTHVFGAEAAHTLCSHTSLQLNLIMKSYITFLQIYEYILQFAFCKAHLSD